MNIRKTPPNELIKARERERRKRRAAGIQERVFKPLREYFFEKVEKTETCWLWTGAMYATGYGSIGIPGTLRSVKAHRLSWEMHFGPIPIGMSVCHKCDTPACVNPAHLFLGTHADNMEDRQRKGRTAHGEQSCHKLSERDVIEIRNDPRGPTDVARDYGVSAPTICDIRARRSWKHISAGMTIQQLCQSVAGEHA